MNKKKRYFEPHYRILDRSINKMGIAEFGPMSSFTWNSDPKRLLFVLSRYKFAAKVLEGCKNVIEIGCGDGFASRIVRQHVSKLMLVDADPLMINHAMRIQSNQFNVEFAIHDFSKNKYKIVGFDGAYMLDVLEHIPKKIEKKFINNLRSSLKEGAKFVVGMPSLESQKFASPGSKAGHVNCKTKEELYKFLSSSFKSVTCYSMNDEVIHTGFSRMSNYIFAVCVK
jgi:2-polyprenyl-3-methyl-5-hydroxy-6-metoxy-1,4-benzoquinol methylase